MNWWVCVKCEPKSSQLKEPKTKTTSVCVHWVYLIHEFHNLSWITEINELFHDILIYWDVPVPRGAVKGGKVRTILRAHDGRGPPEGETWFLPRGTLEPCISARPRPGFNRANFHVIIQTFRHPSISDEKNCRAGGNNTRPCCCGCQERLCV